MKNDELISLLNEIQRKEKRLLEEKFYLKDENFAEIFDKTASILGISSEEVAFTLLMKHFLALQKWLFKHKKDIITTTDLFQLEKWILDIRNYFFFIYALFYRKLK